MNAITVRDLKVAIVNAAERYGRACGDYDLALAWRDFDAAAKAERTMERQMRAVRQLAEDLAEAARREAVR